MNIIYQYKFPAKPLHKILRNYKQFFKKIKSKVLSASKIKKLKSFFKMLRKLNRFKRR